MFETLFAMPLAVRFFIAFIVVLALIAAAAWAVRRFGGARLGGGGSRGRQPRLAVIEAANVDARRRLLLIRRDNTEHLLMIGGPTDIVIEPNIVRAPAREPARVENGWPLQPVSEPPSRGREADEHWPPEPPPRPRATETLGRSATPLSPRSSPELAPASPKPEPRPHAPAPFDSAADQNLADMASQLEAALRREAPKPGESPRPPREVKMRIDPRIEARSEPKLDVKPETRPEPKLDVRPEPKFEPRAEPKPLFTPEPKREPKLDVKPEPIAPKPEIKPEAKPETKADAPSRQDFYDNLEEEMASLLGRPPGKP
jgi:flagellar protein FliO/FliZ